VSLTSSGSQTVGPFFRIGLEHLYASPNLLTDGKERVTVRGRVIDGEGSPVPDAMLEIWSSVSGGEYGSAELDEGGLPLCFARVATDEHGGFSFSICKPCVVSGEAEPTQAPHVAVLVFARGLLRHLMTRMYFPKETGNEKDIVLQLIPEERRGTLMARESSEEGALEWDVVLQGKNETVFFAW
jgi:protocatechuate 3,4-dioxygenase, alpha subunit